ARPSVEDYFDDKLWRGNQRRMINLLRSNARTHALRHKEQGSGVNHPVFFGDEVSRRLHFPSGSWGLLLKACESDWSLCCSKNCDPAEGRVLRESGAKSFMWHPDQPMCIERQLRRSWVRLFSIEHFDDC